MQKSGYIGEFNKNDDGRGGSFDIKLLGAINRCGIVKPRYSVRRTDYEKWESRFFHSRFWFIDINYKSRNNEPL